MGVAAPRSGSPESTTFWGGRRAEAQRRMAEGGFLESRGMTEGQGKKVADPPLRLDDRGAAVPGQIRPVKRSQSVACWRTWEMATGLQASGREIMRVKSVSVRRFCVRRYRGSPNRASAPSSWFGCKVGRSGTSPFRSADGVSGLSDGERCVSFAPPFRPLSGSDGLPESRHTVNSATMTCCAAYDGVRRCVREQITSRFAPRVIAT